MNLSTCFRELAFSVHVCISDHLHVFIACTYIYIYIYIYVCVCVCVCVYTCEYMCAFIIYIYIYIYIYVCIMDASIDNYPDLLGQLNTPAYLQRGTASQQVSWYGIKRSDVEAPVMLEFLRMPYMLSVSSIPGLLKLFVVIPLGSYLWFNYNYSTSKLYAIESLLLNWTAWTIWSLNCVETKAWWLIKSLEILETR